MGNEAKNDGFYGGGLPEGWEEKNLGAIGTFSKGKGILKEQVLKTGLPCVRYGELYTTHNFVFYECCSFISEEIAKESKEIKTGDVLFAGSGETIEEIGKSAAYLGHKTAYAGGDVIILSTKGNVDVSCLAYALETDLARKQKRRLGQGNSVVHIYPSDLATLKLLLPSLPEQRAIAACLSAWDTAIQKTTQLIAQKELRKKWLMQQLLTGKKRLKGFEGEWREVRVKDSFQFLKSYAIPRDGLSKNGTKGNIYCIHYGDIHAQYETVFLDFAVQENIPKIIDKHVLTQEKDYLKNGDIVMADASEDHVGIGEAVEIINLERKSAVGGLHTIVLRDFVNATVPGFRAYLFASEKVRNELRRKATGTSVYSVTKSTLENLVIAIPNYEEQTAIAQILQTADREIQLLKAKVEKMREQKKGVMQVLLTGKVRFKI